MSDIEQQSLRYFVQRGCDPQWQDFLHAMSRELAAQLSVPEMRGFYFAVGARMANASPVSAGASLTELESAFNDWLAQRDWGFVSIRDRQSVLDFSHACAPLRAAFGESGMTAAGAILEGLYGTWLGQLGVDDQLELRQIGDAEGPADVLKFRLAHQSLFA
ncbi:cellulose biosynthesis protein BcsD [Polycyclovorans algicola]|uniref:cellulose biosynthesis protein BcsD n=1 Tax=Polycyclovorans algicola TaxID=616992 RepID=UPI00069374E1|nr:cellulose biosynthesis protein BcsD [Polycyclovorans algicola]